MTRQKIAFIAHGPGTSNALFPLIKELEKDYNLSLFPFHKYASKQWNTPIVSMNSFESIFDEHFDLILTGTGSMHEVEQRTPLLARQNGIVTVSILDIGGNYQERYKNKPDYVISLDKNSTEEILKEGFKPQQVYPLGNPHFDRLKSFVTKQEIHPPYKVAFFSQPTEKAKIAFNDLIRYKKEHSEMIESIYATPHPREDPTWLKDVTQNLESVIFKGYQESFDLLLSTDVSVGVNCTLQQEGLMIGKQTIFYKDREQLEQDFNSLVANSNKQRPLDDFKATERCLAFIHTLLDSMNEFKVS